MLETWIGFKNRDWQLEVNTRGFIQANYTLYEGDESFLAEAIESTIISHDAGYINKDLETIVGLQTDKPPKRYSIPLMVM